MSAVTGISGIQLSAASAAYAPTNSAEVSAIASAYQVVSSLGGNNSYVTSINSKYISATHAFNAEFAKKVLTGDGATSTAYISSLGGIDSATCSAIASAYAESAVSSKQDASAMSAYALSADVSGVIDTVSSNSASWAGGITGDYLTAKIGSGQATFYTAFQDGLEKRPALVISAQRNAGSSVYPRMLVTDWNNTTGETHSGALLANAFEFYICPESAWGEVDPSGIVQSRLDASHLRFNVDPSVTSFTKSSEYTRYGMRLGSAGNSASWVTISGNSSSGGFVTLDDGSGAYGRIVASSIPYWDDKIDGSASSSFYSTANESGYVDSAYVESQVSGKQDTLTFDWDADSAISSINGSALAGGGVDSISADSNFTGNGSTGSPLGLSSQIATGNWSAGNSGFRTNIANSNSDHFDFAIGKRPNATNTAWTWFGLAALRSATGYALSQCDFIFGSMAGANSANHGIVSGELYGISAQAHSKGELRFSLKYPSAYINISSVGSHSPQVYAYAGDRSAYIKMSKRVGTASENSSIYNRALLDSNYLEFKKYYTGYIDTADTASGTSYLGTTAQMEASSIPYWNGKADSSALSSYVPYSSLEYNTASAISGINGSALAAGSTYSAGEGIDITDDVISVEAPVDIVAGPGIVIDNPDGNTLRVSVAQAEEVVLWEGTAYNAGDALAMSENCTNFEKLQIYGYAHEAGQRKGVVLAWPYAVDTEIGVTLTFSTITYSTRLKITTGGNMSVLDHVNYWKSGSAFAFGTDGVVITKIVGIHRLANN